MQAAFANLPWWVRLTGFVSGWLMSAYSSKFPDHLQVAGAYSGVLLASLAVVATLWHWVNNWREKRGKPRFILEPTHLIVVGLLVAAIGVGWQIYRGTPQSPAENAQQNEASISPPPQSDPAPITKPKPHYQPEEIGQMLTTLLGMRGILDQMPSTDDIEGVKGPWDRIVRTEGPAVMAGKLKAIADKSLAGLNALDRLLESNKHFGEELYPTILPDRDPSLTGFISTSHQMVHDLTELARAQNVDVVKWTKPHFDDWVLFSQKYLQWARASNGRITAKTKELREWKNTEAPGKRTERGISQDSTKTLRATEFRPSELSGAAWSGDKSTLKFDASVEERAECELECPSSWSNVAIQFRVHWSRKSTTTNYGVVFGLRGKLADDINAPFADLLVCIGETSRSDFREWTDWSNAELFPSVSQGEIYSLQLYRAVANIGDTLAIDARVHAVQIRACEPTPDAKSKRS